MHDMILGNGTEDSRLRVLVPDPQLRRKRRKIKGLLKLATVRGTLRVENKVIGNWLGYDVGGIPTICMEGNCSYKNNI